MAKKSFELRFDPDVVDRLRRAALAAAFQRGVSCSWAQLVREGADLILRGYEDVEQAQPNKSLEVAW